MDWISTRTQVCLAFQELFEGKCSVEDGQNPFNAHKTFGAICRPSLCAGIGSSSVHAWIILLTKFLFIPCYTYCKKNLIPVKFPSFLLYIQSPQLLSIVNLFLVFFFLANLPKHMHNNLALFHSEMATGLCQSLVADTFLARGNIRIRSVICCWKKTIQKVKMPSGNGPIIAEHSMRSHCHPLPLHFYRSNFESLIMPK